MVSLMTLKGLEAKAEREFEKQADKWVRALAEREGIESDELRPYIVSLHYEPDRRLEIVFVIPGHTPIQVWADYYAFVDRVNQVVPRIEDGRLIGDYCWMARRSATESFTGARDLGHALLIARWAYEENEKAKWA